MILDGKHKENSTYKLSFISSKQESKEDCIIMSSKIFFYSLDFVDIESFLFSTINCLVNTNLDTANAKEDPTFPFLAFDNLKTASG